MSLKPPTSLQQAWYRWKSLKLPWRKRFLVGLDLQGNTFWEFRDALSSDKSRMRRILKSKSTHSDIKISPDWHQWLRHVRRDPPTLTEQSQELLRQQNLKVLAAEADARWAAKPSFLNSPRKEQNPGAAKSLTGQGVPAQHTEPPDRVLGDTPGSPEEQLPWHKGYVNQAEGKVDASKVKDDTASQSDTPKPKSAEPEDPWKQARGGLSESWQPKAWNESIIIPKLKNKY